MIRVSVLASAFAILWFVVFFCLLPVGIGGVDRETGAPLHPHLARKAAIATAIAVPLFALFYALIAFGMLDL